MQRFFEYARRDGNNSRFTAPGATITVYDAGTTTLASIYSDNTPTGSAPGTDKSNPFTADSNTGFFDFYAIDGRYDVRISGTGVTTAYQWNDVLLEDTDALGWISVKDHGATGDGSTDDRAAFVSAAAAASNPVLFVPPGTYRIASDWDPGASVHFYFQPGASLVPDASVTVTIQGSVEAGNYQIFDTSAASSKVDLANTGRINCVWYSSSGDGTSANRWVDALRRAFASNNPGGDNADNNCYYLPAGQYEDTSTIPLSINGNYRVVGDGYEVTQIYYQQTDDTSAIKIDRASPAGSQAVDITIEDLSFFGASVATGAALEVEDVDNIKISRIKFNDFDGTTDTTKSIGIWTKGRDSTAILDCRFANCTCGIRIDNNPNHATLGLDAYTIDRCQIICNDAVNGIGIRIDADESFNSSIRNTVMTTCLRGIQWIADTSDADSLHFVVDNCRVESIGTVANGGWGYYIEIGDAGDVNHCNNLTFSNCRASNGAAGGGFFIHGARYIHLISCSTGAGEAGSVNLDVDQSGAAITPTALFMVGWNNPGGSSKESISNIDNIYRIGSDLDNSHHRYYDDAVNYKFASPMVLPDRNALSQSGGGTLAIDASISNYVEITVTDASAFTVGNPTSPTQGQILTFDVYNNSGGAMGAITWGTGSTFRLAGSFTNPADGQHRIITFQYNGTSWRETSRTAADQAN